jgi:hypothetical protein
MKYGTNYNAQIKFVLKFKHFEAERNEKWLPNCFIVMECERPVGSRSKNIDAG